MSDKPLSYSFGLGFIQKENQNIGSFTTTNIHKDFSHPVYTNIPLINLNLVAKLTDNFSLNNYLITDIDNLFDTFGIDGYFGVFHIKPGVLFSSLGDQGAFIDSNLSLGHINAYIQYLQLYKIHDSALTLDSYENGTQFDGEVIGKNFNPITLSKEQINTSLSYYWEKNIVICWL